MFLIKESLSIKTGSSCVPSFSVCCGGLVCVGVTARARGRRGTEGMVGDGTGDGTGVGGLRCLISFSYKMFFFFPSVSAFSQLVSSAVFVGSDRNIKTCQ